MPVTLDWGSRSERLRTLHKNLGGARSYLLTKAPTPVALGALTASQIVSWQMATVTPILVTPVSGTFTATAALPASTTHVRLDFDLKVTIGAATASCLAFRQLFTVGPGDVLMPVYKSIQDHLFKAATARGLDTARRRRAGHAARSTLAGPAGGDRRGDGQLRSPQRHRAGGGDGSRRAGLGDPATGSPRPPTRDARQPGPAAARRCCGSWRCPALRYRVTTPPRVPGLMSGSSARRLGWQQLPLWQ